MIGLGVVPTRRPTPRSAPRVLSLACLVVGCGSITLVERPDVDAGLDATLDGSIDAADDSLRDAPTGFPCDGDWELVDGRGLLTSCCSGRTCLGRCAREGGVHCDCGGLADCPLGTVCCVNKDSGATGCAITCVSGTTK